MVKGWSRRRKREKEKERRDRRLWGSVACRASRVRRAGAAYPEVASGIALNRFQELRTGDFRSGVDVGVGPGCGRMSLRSE